MTSGCTEFREIAWDAMVYTDGKSHAASGAIRRSPGVVSIRRAVCDRCRPARESQHMRALPQGAVADALATVRGSQAPVTTNLVFRSLRGKPLSNTTLSKLIKELDLAAVPHGFRSSFRDWAAEQTNTPREVVEAALAHTVRDPTEAAYARSDLFERRRRLMDDGPLP